MMKFKEFVTEQALKMEGNLYSKIGTKEQRTTMFNAFHKDEVLEHISPTIKLQKNTNESQTIYSVNNHNTKETESLILMLHNKADNLIPFAHKEASLGDKIKESKLPKHYVSNVIYGEFVKDGIPIRSSSIHYEPGHKSWVYMTNKALNDGHHVYFFDGKTFHKTNYDNMTHHLTEYCGYDEAQTEKHMFIMKKPL